MSYHRTLSGWQGRVSGSAGGAPRARGRGSLELAYGDSGADLTTFQAATGLPAPAPSTPASGTLGGVGWLPIAIGVVAAALILKKGS